MHDTNKTGDVSESKFVHEFLKRNIPVFLPFNNNGPIDMVIKIRNKLYSVQIKTGRRTKSDGIKVSMTRGAGKKLGYFKQADLVGVYYPYNDKCYLLPVDNSSNYFVLALDSENKNTNTKMAVDYELDLSLGLTQLIMIYDIDQYEPLL